MLTQVHEPMRWCMRLGTRVSPEALGLHFRHALRGFALDDWNPPAWLLPHQTDAARRIAGRLHTLGGALLCDAVGLGKTYVALGVATRYSEPIVVSPAVLVEQWRRVARSVGVPSRVVSHESLSRGGDVPAGDLVIVDEAHHHRNPDTVRHQRLAVGVGAAPVLLLTATPVVNRPRDILTLLRIFADDRFLAMNGIPSLDEARAGRPSVELSAAIAGVVVARSPESAGISSDAIPAAHDEPVLRTPVLPGRLQSCAATVLDALEFPAFTDRAAAALLRMNAYHRLASSVSAFRECLQRHIAYLDRAIRAARRGERLSRRAARTLFAREDELQIELPLGGTHAAPVAVEALERDRARLAGLLARIPRDLPSPKMSMVQAAIETTHYPSRGKTLVFTSAVASTHELARRLGWKRIGVVTGRGARIASGPISLPEVLGAFRDGNGRVAIDTLITTDLLSEGLDLQIANRVVHFDIPWNPVRLQQRLGRIARLGSAHREVRVSWFAPPPGVERALRVGARVRAKAAAQRVLGVSVTSRVGRARVLGRSLERRERLLAVLPGRGALSPGFAVVAGEPAAVFAVRWRWARHTETTLVAYEGDPPRLVGNLGEACDLLESLLEMPGIDARFPEAVMRALAEELRRRQAFASRAPMTPLARRLTRCVVRRAVAAGRHRDVAVIERLDMVLDRLARGVRLGAERDLAARLAEDRSLHASLDEWLRAWHVVRGEGAIAEVAAAIAAVGG